MHQDETSCTKTEQNREAIVMMNLVIAIANRNSVTPAATAEKHLIKSAGEFIGVQQNLSNPPPHFSLTLPG